MSYTLLQAGRLWQEPRYSRIGAALALLMEKHEIADLPHFGPMLLPGAKGFYEKRKCVLNPSYAPLQLIQALAIEFPDSIWNRLSAVLPKFLEKSASAGYAMDWVAYSDGKFRPTDGPGRGPGGSYDAIRVYLWAGMLAKDAPARETILRAIPAMGDYLQEHTIPPERVSPEGRAVRTTGSIGFSAAVLPYLDARSEPGPADRQAARLAASWNRTTGLYGQNPTYYDQNLALFATGWREGRFRFGRNGELQVAWSEP
jgi:endoglucanase